MHTCHFDGLSLAQWLPASLTAVTPCMCTVNKRMNECVRFTICISPMLNATQQYLRFFLSKLTAVHVDQLLLVNAPTILYLSLSFSRFFSRFTLFLTSFRMAAAAFFISFHFHRVNCVRHGYSSATKFDV